MDGKTSEGKLLTNYNSNSNLEGGLKNLCNALKSIVKVPDIFRI